jgi:hypothetical protein
MRILILDGMPHVRATTRGALTSPENAKRNCWQPGGRQARPWSPTRQVDACARIMPANINPQPSN